LKRSPYARQRGDSKIGFENATLRWNTGKVTEETNGVAAAVPPAPVSPGTSDQSTAVEEAVFSLSDLNVEFPIGKLSIVTGPTGSGKTAVLTALLGEMELLEGHSYLPKDYNTVDEETGLRNSVAYAAQTPWLQQLSIKDNILFGEKFDEERYEATLEACAL
jgi:ABC-type transport system involved in cytochrome bd biosynthesis fused ATPase/permease subunit